MPQFIHSQFVEDTALADRFIDYYKSNTSKHIDGKVGKNGAACVDPSIKNSREISMPSEEAEISKEFCDQLQIVLDEYVKIYPEVNKLAKFTLVPYNIQYYKPNEGGYFQWHSERHTGTYPDSSRILVWMMYCHTIDNGGGTEFLHQNYTCKSEKGKIVIWPVDWTFTHRGVRTDREKMIITGWYNFLQDTIVYAQKI